MAKSILIIEDDKNIAELERDYLEANGYEVDTKLNGESGLEAALKQNYNLILLDLMLPGMDGFEICRCIRREKDIPILMVSAKKKISIKYAASALERTIILLSRSALPSWWPAYMRISPGMTA